MATPVSIMKKTQSSLGKFITRPPLTDKLLSKPPFRFLQDIVAGLVRNHKLFPGLFTPEELTSEKDKEGKMKFLEKVLDCTAFALGSNPLSARPGKIVSGQEPDKTNEFLQALASIIDQKIDTKEAVRKVLAGEKPGKSATESLTPKVDSGSTGTSKTTSKSKTVSPASKKATQNIKSPSKSTEKTPSKIASEQASIENPSSAITLTNIKTDENSDLMTQKTKKGNDETKSAIKVIETKDPSKIIVDTTEKKITHPSKDEQSSGKLENIESKIYEEPKTSDSRPGTSGASRPITSYGRKPIAPPSPQDPINEPLPKEEPTVFGSGAPIDPEMNPEQRETPIRQPSARPGSSMITARPKTGGRMKSARPISARPAAPRLRDKNVLVSEKGASDKPIAGLVANVIVAGEEAENEDDDENGFIIEEKLKDELDLKTKTTIKDSKLKSAALENDGQNLGGLVHKILETQRELENAGNHRKAKFVGEIERENGMADLFQQRERDSTQLEVDRLRESIQKLTRSANPLCKLMDFLQEDIESMQRDLEMWRDENRDLRRKLKQEERETEKAVEPLREKLAELEVAVQDQLDQISYAKTNIMKNEIRLSKLISSIGE